MTAIAQDPTIEPGQLSAFAVGIELLPTTILAAEVESPTIDARSNRWLWYHTGIGVVLGPTIDALYGVGLVQVLTAARIPIDGKGKRRISENDNIWISMGVQGVSADLPPHISLAWSIRFLFQET